MNPGIHLGVAEAVYHADPCHEPSASASILRLMVDASPAHAWHAHPRLNPAHAPTDPSSDMLLGTAAHALILEQRDIVDVIEAADWRGKDAREAKKAALAAGRVPILADDFHAIEGMAKAVRHTLGTQHEAHDFMVESDTEATLIWHDDFWCRARVDVLPRRDGWPVYDLKTTRGSASPAMWSRRLFDDGKDIQAAFYLRGLRALGRDPGPFRFVVVEQEPPHCVSVIQLEPEAVDFAKRRLDAALSMWENCLRNNVWPGYPPFVAHVEAPVYARAREEQRAMSERMAASVGLAHVARAAAAGVDPRI